MLAWIIQQSCPANGIQIGHATRVIQAAIEDIQPKQINQL